MTGTRTVTETASIWADGRPKLTEKSVDYYRECDVSVVGAGIAGLTTAYLLAREGKSVVVLDAGEAFASGETEYTTAHLSSVLDDRFASIVKVRGDEVTRQAYQAHCQAIDLIESLVHELKIDCGFRRIPGYLFPDVTQDTSELNDEEAACHRTHAKFDRLPQVPSREFQAGECLRFADQARFQPIAYLAGIREAFLKLGGEIFVRTRVEKVTPGETVKLQTREGPALVAKHCVVATNSPINDVVALHTKMYPYLTYAVAIETPAVADQDDGLFWDMLDPYHYVRFTQDRAGRWFAIVGGEDHKTGQPEKSAEECWNALESWARGRMPNLGEVTHRWSGQVMETLDGLAYIGADPGSQENVFIATGDSGMGMTHGTIAGILLTDLILGRDNPWKEVFDPSRKPTHSVGTFLSENANVAGQYTSWLTGSDVSSRDEIQPGQGAVVRSGLTKLAVYRDESGTLHEMSAVCPHLGGIVGWNAGSQTWDCPCHGSRFTCTGKVQHGPAVSDLKPVPPAE